MSTDTQPMPTEVPEPPSCPFWCTKTHAEGGQWDEVNDPGKFIEAIKRCEAPLT